LLHFAAVFIHFGNQLSKRGVAQPGILDFLLKVFAIEEFLLEKAS